MSERVSVGRSVIEKAKSLIDEPDPAIDADNRPRINQITAIEVIDEFEDSDTYVEIFLEIHRNGQACEPLTIEYHPHKNDYSGLFILDKEQAVVKILQKGKLDEQEQKKFRVFAAVVGRLTYYGS